MSQGLSEEQRDILNFFEQFQRDFKQQPINDVYLKGSTTEIYEQPCNDWVKYPIMNEVEFQPQYDELRLRLNEYKKRSKLVQQVGNLMHEYQTNFRHMLDQRKQLMQLIESINRDTTDLVAKQKNYINLSMAVKESLDYYSYLDKFQFNWACEISCRDMFEDQLQPILSQFTDAIQFFSQNINYSSAKKYLNGLVSARTKVTSFTKSFFIKILNKQLTFVTKNVKGNIWSHIDSFYPKSKAKFLVDFISLFPQFKKNLKFVLMSCKESGSEGDVNAVQSRQFEIQEFQFHDSTLSLIGYLQTSIPQMYEEVILKFISYYRINLHQNLHKTLEFDKNVKFTEAFREVFTKVVYILTSEAAYLFYCFKSNSEIASEYFRTTLAKIAQFYSQTLVRFAKQPNKNKDPFSICNEVTFCLEETQKFFRNYLTHQYQSYAIGAVISYIEDSGVDLIKNIINGIGSKIKAQLQLACQNFLPKFKPQNQQSKLTQQVRQFISIIPNLKYCPNQAEKYLVTSLDTIIKSVKEVNHRIQSRLECYAWDLEIFTSIQQSLQRLPYNLIKKQMRLDMNQTTSVIDKVKRVNRDDNNLLKYASDIFSVIKAGVPTLNELTLDFNKYIKEYLEDLKYKFVKDMVFVHAKNIIQFLQKLKKLEGEEASKICQLNMLKSLQSSYILSIQNYIEQAKIILLKRKNFILYSSGEQELKKLILEVQQALLDMMSTFYIETTKYCSETQKFQPISVIRSNLQKVWQNKKNMGSDA